MFSTLAGLLVAVGFVLPGFIVVDLAESRRARPKRSDPELILRALTYALVIQGAIASTGWSGELINKTDSGRLWDEHVGDIVLFTAVVVIIGPTLLGLGLNRLLLKAEKRGNLRAWHYALGGRDARQGWDYIFERFGSGFVFITLKPGVEGRPSFFIAQFGESSWAPQQAPDIQDVYFEGIWIADETGQIVSEFTNQRGLWLPLSQIDMIQFIDPPGPKLKLTRSDTEVSDQDRGL